MKKEWLVINIAAVGSPARAERGIFGQFLKFFPPNNAAFVVEKYLTLCSGNTLLSPKKPT